MRFYAENSEYPRVIDSRDRFAVFTAGAGEFHTAENVARAMNRIWERDVEFVAEWIGDQLHMDQPAGELRFGHALIDAWREEMT
jgi:hypothetical protein